MTRTMHRARTIALLVTAGLVTAACGSEASVQPTPADEPGRTTVSLYTHCGVESANIEGRWWHARPALYNQDRSGPPAGWGDPYQEGTLTMEAADRAVFEALGERVVFVPAGDDQPPRACQ